MRTTEFETALKKGHAKEALDQLCDELESLFFSKGIAALSEEQRIVLGVASFVGQVRDGGLQGFINSPWAAFLGDLEPGFTRIALPEYATIASRLQGASEHTDPKGAIADAEDAFWAAYYTAPGGGVERIDQGLAKFVTVNPRALSTP